LSLINTTCRVGQYTESAIQAAENVASSMGARNSFDVAFLIFLYIFCLSISLSLKHLSLDEKSIVCYHYGNQIKLGTNTYISDKHIF